MIARHFVRAQKNLVDAVGAIVRAGGENIAAFEVNDLDNAVVLETNGSGEALPSQFDEPLDQIQLADIAFQLHPNLVV